LGRKSCRKATEKNTENLKKPIERLVKKVPRRAAEEGQVKK